MLVSSTFLPEAPKGTCEKHHVRVICTCVSHLIMNMGGRALRPRPPYIASENDAPIWLSPPAPTQAPLAHLEHAVLAVLPQVRAVRLAQHGLELVGAGAHLGLQSPHVTVANEAAIGRSTTRSASRAPHCLPNVHPPQAALATPHALAWPCNSMPLHVEQEALLPCETLPCTTPRARIQHLPVGPLHVGRHLGLHAAQLGAHTCGVHEDTERHQRNV